MVIVNDPVHYQGQVYQQHITFGISSSQVHKSVTKVLQENSTLGKMSHILSRNWSNIIIWA